MAKGREAQLLQRGLLSVAMVDIRTALLKADTGDLDDAIAIARATLNELTNSGEMLIRGAASAALVAALLMRGNDTDVDEAEAAIERLAAAPTEPGFVLHEIHLMRMRALLARAHGDEAAYRDYRDRYRDMATSLGFEGHMRGPRRCHDGGCSFGGGDVSVHRCRGFDPSVGGRRGCDAGGPAAHDEVLRTAIEEHDGFLFSHTGDGVVAAFASPSSAVDAAVAAQRALELPVRMGHRDRGGRAAGRGLLRHGAQPCGAGDGRRAWRSDPAGRLDGGLLSGIDLIAWGHGDYGTCQPSRGVPGPGARPAHGLSAIADARCDVRETCAPQTTSFIGRESEVAEVQAALRTHRLGDVDRGGRGRQDPPRIGGRRRDWPMNFPTVSGFSNSLRSLIRRRCPMRWRRCWASPNSRARP